MTSAKTITQDFLDLCKLKGDVKFEIGVVVGVLRSKYGVSYTLSSNSRLIVDTLDDNIKRDEILVSEILPANEGTLALLAIDMNVLMRPTLWDESDFLFVNSTTSEEVKALILSGLQYQLSTHLGSERCKQLKLQEIVVPGVNQLR